MLSLPGSEARTWNPHSHRGELRGREGALRRKDLWFYFALAVLLVLLFVVWQQTRGLQLGAEVARLELRREALQTQIVQQAVRVAQRRQPGALGVEVASAPAAASAAADPEAGLSLGDLEGRVFVATTAGAQAPARPQDSWQASVGLGVAPALARDDR
ncbi:hypothetical protein FJ251_09320 [bacterium]|nr:hypothetical protein [bacterium]